MSVQYWGEVRQQLAAGVREDSVSGANGMSSLAIFLTNMVQMTYTVMLCTVEHVVPADSLRSGSKLAMRAAVHMAGCLPTTGMAGAPVALQSTLGIV
jgi:hypothetical protein